MERAIKAALLFQCLALVIAPAASAFETAVERVPAGGVIMDVSPTKILFRDPIGSPSVGLHIQDRATGTVEDVEPDRFPTLAFLSPHGAIFSGGVNHPNIRLLEWRDGVLLDHGQPSSQSVLRAAGNYAAWSAPGAPGGGEDVYR